MSDKIKLLVVLPCLILIVSLMSYALNEGGLPF